MEYCEKYAELEEFLDQLKGLEPTSKYYKNIIEDMMQEVQEEMNEIEPMANAEYQAEINERNREYYGGLL